MVPRSTGGSSSSTSCGQMGLFQEDEIMQVACVKQGGHVSQWVCDVGLL